MNSQLITGAVARFIKRLLTSTGAAMVGFIQSGVGAIIMTIQAKLRQHVHVKDFGGVGDGIADDTLAIQRAHAASLVVDYGGPENVYLTYGVTTLRSGSMPFGSGATVQQMTPQTEIFNIEGKSDINGFGMKYVGVGTDFNDDDSSRAVAFYGGVGGGNIHLRRNVFHNFGYCSARFRDQENVSFVRNKVVGPGAPTLTDVTSGSNYGVLFDSGCRGALAYGNDISKTAQGIQVEGTWDCRAIFNRIHQIVGQHGIYAGSGLNGFVAAFNNIRKVPIIGIKVQAQDYAGAHNENIVVGWNTVEETGDHSIVISSAVSPSTYNCRNVNVGNNTLRKAGGAGVSLNNVEGAVVGNNCMDECNYGVFYSDCSELKIDTNNIRRSKRSAIRDGIPSVDVSITNNKGKNCATLAEEGDRYGLFIQNATEHEIKNNNFGDKNANMEYGVFLAGGDMSTVTLEGNVVTESTAQGCRNDSSAPMRSYKGNSFYGTLGDTTNDPDAPTVVAAENLRLPPNQSVIRVSAGPAITYVNPNGYGCQTVVFLPEAGVTFMDGGNLRLNGSFTATENDAFSMTCAGGNWYQCGGSAN